jgi:predicted NBD/HSP70 family sugar kinase
MMMRSKTDNTVMRRMNRAMVIKALRLRGPMARIDIGQLTGLSPATITTISADLILEKAILELDDTPTLVYPLPRGRPMVRINLNPNAAMIIAAKISIDCIELVLANFAGMIIARKTTNRATNGMSSEVFGRALASTVSLFLKENNLEPHEIARIGVAAQGLVDARSGIILWSPAFRNHNIHVTAPIQEKLGIPCSLANDANMIAEGLMAKERFGFTGNAVIVFMGYGVGMGLVIDGAVYHGNSGAAAEFGHMNHLPGGALCRCGRYGCIEAYVSDYGILRSAEKPLDKNQPSTIAVDPALMRRLENAARCGDLDAVAAYQKAGRAMGFGLARVIALFNPDRIILAGPGICAFDLIEPSMSAAIEEGIVDELRLKVKIETIPTEFDMIIAGTIDTTLRHLDSEVFANGPQATTSAFMAMQI